ncbi:MFS transporter [Trinickia mobilis]|uniref:MFS transporter n=1 Tax=Trinickia mobilis TaxID=2816356 RepID=UPI001A8D2F4F|nr:MFS transporter [Trinickia mobilis]
MREEQLAASALRKINRRFIPLLFICFVSAWLDRVNIGFAALTMNRDIGLSATAYGLGAGIFFLTYVVLELPSNLLLERFGARRWIAQIMFGWGIFSAAMVFVQGEKSFYAVRLLLGAAEAGFVPGVMFFLTLWVPAAARGRMIAGFLVAMPVASVIGAPLSGLLMQLNGIGGLHGWQWLFPIEALPALALTPIILRTLSDTPAQAEWLTDAERDWLNRSLAAEAVKAPSGHGGVLKRLFNPLMLALGVAYSGANGINFGLSFFLPQIVRAFGLSVVQAGFVVAIPFTVAAIGMIWWGRRSDRLGERRFHLVVPLMLAVIGLAGSTLVDPPVLRLALLCLAAFGVYATLTIFWTLPAALLPAGTLAAGVAVMNSVGNLSGFAGPYVVGAIKEATGSFAGGMQVVAGFGMVAVGLVLLITRNATWTKKASVQSKEQSSEMVYEEIEAKNRRW